MPEPRDPLLKVLTIVYSTQTTLITEFEGMIYKGWEVYPEGQRLFNDPSAGSPTETLLRLLLPLNDQVWTAFRLWVVVADLPEPVRSPH